MITPTRVIFDDRERSQTVTLINTTNETQVYRMSFVDKVQRSGGGYTNLEVSENSQPAADYFSASEMLRFSPRQVVLAPKQSQTIRISLRKPANLAYGEYRTHLEFKVLPKENNTLEGNSATGFKLRMLTSFTIPIQVRQGKPEVKVSIAHPALGQENGITRIQLTLNRQGQFSAFGSIKVFWKSQEIDSYEQVGVLNNAAIYRELEALSIALPLNKQIKNGFFRVEYQADKHFEKPTFDSLEFHL